MILGSESIPCKKIHSEMELSPMGEEIIVGFKKFTVREHLGILSKLEDEKGYCRWAILERN